MVRSARLGSFSSFCSVACKAASIGMLVNSDSTLKDTMISLSKIVSLQKVDTNHRVNSKDRNAPIRAVEKQLITVENHAL